MGTKKINTLFTYGTLMQAERIKKIIGRLPDSSPAIIYNYSAYQLLNRSYPGLLPSDQQTSGLLYLNLTHSEIEKLDEYEGDEYNREIVTIMQDNQPQQTYCYLFKQELNHIVTKKIWTPK